MSSTISGQINKFNFPSVAAGVNDPVFGNDLETIFESEWAKQIAAPAVVEAEQVGGNEHLRAEFGNGPVSDLMTNLAMPPSSVLTFQYLADQLIAPINVAWIFATSANGRLSMDTLLPDPHGIVELTGLSITGASTTWTISLTGIVHSPYALPAIPFSVSRQEDITLLRTQAASFSLQYHSYPPVTNYDLGNFKTALTLLEVLLGGAIGTLLLGPFGVGLLAYGIGEIDEYIAMKLKQVSLPFAALAPVLSGIPQRVQLPGTSDNLWIHYDSLSFPQGLIAQNAGHKGVETEQPGAVLGFSGTKLPLRSRIIGLVFISGPASVVLISIVGPGAPRNPIAVVRQYSSFCSDQAVNPVFTWSVTDQAGHAVAGVRIANPDQQNVSIFFNDGGRATPNGVVLVKVHMDDDLHLKDANGNLPSAVYPVTVTHETQALPQSSVGSFNPLRPIQ